MGWSGWQMKAAQTILRRGAVWGERMSGLERYLGGCRNKYHWFIHWGHLEAQCVKDDGSVKWLPGSEGWPRVSPENRVRKVIQVRERHARKSQKRVLRPGLMMVQDGERKGTERHGPGLRRLACCSACCSLLCWGCKIRSCRRACVQRDLKKTDFLKKPVRTKSPMKPETNLSSGNGHSEWGVL